MQGRLIEFGFEWGPMKVEKTSGPNSRPLDKMVRLRCARTGCPRTRKIVWDDTMPVGTTTVVSACPWHAGDTTTEDYYDTNGRWHGPDGWVEQSNDQVQP